MSEAQTVHLVCDDGARAVELARGSVESYVLHGQRGQPGSTYDTFYAQAGVFIRIKSTRECGRLRGCVGVYRGGDQLGHAITGAAIEAASGDSCQTGIEAPKLSSLNVSVCIVNNYTLTNDPVADVELDTHGIAIDAGGTHGWMYPTLSVEPDWSREESLMNAYRKVDLSPLAWQDSDAMITLFEGQVFRKRGDGGSVEAL